MFRVIVSIMLGLMLSLLVAGSGEALAARDHCASAPGITQIHVNQDCALGHQTGRLNACALPGLCVAGTCLGLLASPEFAYLPVALDAEFQLQPGRRIDGLTYSPPFEPPRLTG